MRGARYPKLVAIRRMVGVAAFAYAFAHLTLYVVDQHFDLAHVASEIALRFYLTIGFVAWLGLAALAATSTDAMIRRLGASGGPAFARLRDRRPRPPAFHDPGEGRRVGAGDDDRILRHPDAVPRIRETRLPAWGATVAAAVVSPPLTALVEAAWYALVRHIPFWEVLSANVDPDMAFRPSAYVAAAGAAFVVVALLRRSPAPRRVSVTAAQAAPSASR